MSLCHAHKLTLLQFVYLIHIKIKTTVKYFYMSFFLDHELTFSHDTIVTAPLSWELTDAIQLIQFRISTSPLIPTLSPLVEKGGHNFRLYQQNCACIKMQATHLLFF